MDTKQMSIVEKKYVVRNPDIRPGDTVAVHIRIVEAGKERVQVFEGVVISKKGSGTRKMITVRKVSHGVGVEKILPVNSPLIKKIDILKRGKVRRAKLYYMRNKVGKRSLDVGFDKDFEEVIEKDSVKDVEKKDLETSKSDKDTVKTEEEKSK